MLLGPEEALRALEQREAVLRENLGSLERDLEGHSDPLPRVTLLETEYLRAVTAAELTWVAGVVKDLVTGALTWSDELADMAQSFLSE